MVLQKRTRATAEAVAAGVMLTVPARAEAVGRGRVWGWVETRDEDGCRDGGDDSEAEGAKRAKATEFRVTRAGRW